MAKVVITGAAGFVPAALARALQASGDDVLCWVRPGADTWRVGGTPSLLSLDLRACLDPVGREQAVAALRGFGAQVIVHGAWAGIRGEARNDPDQVENVTVTAALAKVASAAGVSRFVGLGSQAEYGPIAEPISEEAPTRPASLYGASKLAAGHLVLALGRRLGFSVAWARLFSVYGPRERFGALLPDLARALAERRPLPLGDGLQRWDYLYEDDAGTALAALVRTPTAEGHFNVASGRSVLLREVMERVAALVGGGERLRIGERPATSPLHLEAVVSRLHAATGWSPAVELEVGLSRTVNAVLGRAIPGADFGAERERA